MGRFKMMIVRQILKQNSQILSRWNKSLRLKSVHYHLSTSARRNEEDSSKNDRENATNVSPELPTTCCMSGCANCVWLDFAEETIKHYEGLGMKMELDELLNTVETNVEDPMIKSFIKMELKS